MEIKTAYATKSELGNLKEIMEMYQNNIDNNITWFYAEKSERIIIRSKANTLIGVFFMWK